MGGVQFQIGIKRNPMKYSYSYVWLFRLMEQKQITHLQLGTFLNYVARRRDGLSACAAKQRITGGPSRVRLSLTANPR